MGDSLALGRLRRRDAIFTAQASSRKSLSSIRSGINLTKMLGCHPMSYVDVLFISYGVDVVGIFLSGLVGDPFSTKRSLLAEPSLQFDWLQLTNCQIRPPLGRIPPLKLRSDRTQALRISCELDRDYSICLRRFTS